MESACDNSEQEGDERADEYGEELFEQANHCFTIDLWRERPSSAAHAAVWRGRITHIPSNSRRYVQTLDEITAFIVSTLGEIEQESGAG